ncbi:hypothetical protein CAP47_03735 [Psychroflexus sp. S27]|uniref:retropepsin-like aspartic protease n=1 Tax=Psychroflexus sp. S27 TaxID=1982757 RepID=UPI000C2A7A16|nr:retropepsin-like aspartic protease [Psychroflexus sp. S27]PJX24604.1 hypothetical protein CAP47_03735 [Psychroflexus sp. S27]
MRIRKVLFCLLALVLLSSCGNTKALKHFKKGETVEENFKVTLPFETKQGWIIIPVDIKNKTYQFLFDTGAPSIVSKELADHLNLKVIDSIDAYDVYNQPQINKYVSLDHIKIGDINFAETTAIINDFNKVKMWSSLEVDGFVGSNLMQQAIWDVDYKKKEITITDDESQLNLPEDIIENKMFVGYAGLPSIACKINGEKIWNFSVDYGYNGDIVIPFSEFEKQIEESKISDFNKSKTQGAIGIYGKQKNARESYSGIIDEIEFGNTTLKNQQVYAEPYLDKIFGLNFFKNYRVILNWKTKKIKLIEY